jgi:hypothetical protein
MRIVTMTLALVLALLSGSAFAQGFDTPQALLGSIYDGIESGDYPDDDAVYSDSIKALLAADAARTPEGEVGALDFSHFINGQDDGGLSYQLGEPVVDGDSATATVVIEGGRPQAVVYTLIKQADGWRIDDIVGQEAGVDSWRLSEILAADPLLN